MIKPFLALCRISNLPTVWTNVLAALVLSGSFTWPDFLLLSLSLSLFYSGGMCLNDILDAEADRIRKPSRPIPSGKVSGKSAVIFTAALFATAIVILLFFSFQRVWCSGLILLALIIVYDSFHKGSPLSVIFMAACRLMVFWVSAMAVAGTVGLYVKIAGLIQFMYVLIISLAARHEKQMKAPYPFPVIPFMIASISLIDGAVMAVFASPAWLLAGIGGALLTGAGQKYVRGD
ncbi:MAG: UbiA family prenyltransferase [Nitrospirales bacterium]|nr:UbiA family prenyltransferase [Nitrospirales bacterium]